MWVLFNPVPLQSKRRSEGLRSFDSILSAGRVNPTKSNVSSEEALPAPAAVAAKVESASFRRRRLSVETLGEALDDGTTAPARKARSRVMALSTEMGKPVKDSDLLFPKTIVGTYSCHGIEPSQQEGRPHGKINQDRGLISYPFSENSDNAVFAVFDGHGGSGDSCAHFVANALQLLLEDHPALEDEPERALKESFLRADALLQAEASVESSLSGTTATVALMLGKVLHLAWAGDSRAVLARSSKASGGGNVTYTALELSRDHKPDGKSEQARILKRGGYVSPAEDWGGPARVWTNSSMVRPGLAMSRSIGDHLATKVGVVAEPEVTRHVLREDDDFLIIASDGIWEFIDSQAAVNIIARHIESQGATAACSKLILAAAEKWRAEEGDYRDDITAIVIKLPCKGEPALPT